MKTAAFKYTGHGGEVAGTITVSLNGKKTITVNWNPKYSQAQIYWAKKHANDIIAAEFQHPDVTSFKQTADSLIALLKLNTEDLREEFIKQCKDFEVMLYKLRADWQKRLPQSGTIEWYNFFGLKYVAYQGDQKNLYPERGYEKQYREAKSEIEHVAAYLKRGKKENVELAEKHAKRHYIDSIDKLAQRIEDKGLNINKLSIEKARVGINLEMVFTDGNKTIKAWTIVAHGEIKRPHYRYLVK